MARTVRARINVVTLTCGITILVLGILMFPTDFVIAKLIGHDYGTKWSNQPQYWGVIPVIITGVLVTVLSIIKNPPGFLKILSAIFLLVTMFVNLAVIIEQGSYGTHYQEMRKIYCGNEPENHYDHPPDDDCPKLRAIDACFQILLLFSALTLVVSLAALLAMHGNWILDLQQHYGDENAEARSESNQPLVMRAYEPGGFEDQPAHTGVMQGIQHKNGAQPDV